MALILTGMISGERWAGGVLDGFLHMTNGYNRPQVTDGLTTWNMGINPPAAAATFVNNTITGALTAGGTYTYYYTYWCSKRNRESGLSPVSAAMSANAVAGKGIRISIPANASLETGVDYVKVYRIENGGSLYYYDGMVAYAGSAANYDSSVADSALGEIMGELDDDGTTQLDVNGLPPACPYMAVKGGRVGLAGRKVYSTGTAAVTNGNATVTLSGATLTAGMDGWRFRIDGDSQEYIIGTINIAAGTFVLKDLLGNSMTYQGTTGSGKTYYLYGQGSIFFYSHKDLYGNPMPESFYGFDYYPINPDDNDDIMGLGKVRNFWFIPKRNRCYTLSGDTPDEFKDNLLNSEIGTCSHWTIANDRDGNVIWMHDTGVYISDGYTVRCLSHQPESGISIENIFTGLNSPPFYIREGYFELSHGVFDPVSNRYMLWVCTSDYMDSGVASTICDKLLIYDFNKVNGMPIGWYWWDIPASTSCLVHESTDKAVVYFGDEWGFVKKFDSTALNDGIGSGADTRRGTATAATANTLTMATASFYTTDSGLQGCFVAILSGTGAGQIRRISSNNGTQLTVTPNWTVTPDTTSVFGIGAINARRLSKVYDFESLNEKILRKVKMIFNVAATTYSAFFKFFKDFSTTAHQTVYLKLDDSQGYYESSFPANKAIHHQYEYGLHDVDKTMVIREVEFDVEETATPKPRVKQSS